MSKFVITFAEELIREYNYAEISRKRYKFKIYKIFLKKVLIRVIIKEIAPPLPWKKEYEVIEVFGKKKKIIINV